MLIDADFNTGTGWDGADFQLSLEWKNPITKLIDSWDKSIIEHPLPGLSRTIGSVAHNYTGFFEKNGKYVTLSIDLNSIGSPNEYRIIYYAFVKKNDGLNTLDFSSWTDIPPPELSLVSENPIVLRRPSNEIVGVQLKSSTGFIPNIVNFIPIQIPSTIKVKYIHNEPNLSSSGPVSFNIEVPENAPVGRYDIPLLTNISTTESHFPNIFNIKYVPPTKSDTIKIVNLSMTILKPLGFSDWFRQEWDTYGDFIGLIGGGFAAGAASLAFDRVRSRNKKVHAEDE